MSLTTPFPMEALDVRVEDTMLVTETGYENLTTGISRDVDVIEVLTGAWWRSLKKPECIIASISSRTQWNYLSCHNGVHQFWRKIVKPRVQK